MFSSPAVRVYASENVDNLAQRKPANDSSARKPFVDKPVNSKTPNLGNLKQKIAFTKEANVIEDQKTKLEDDLDGTECTYSYMDDSYEEMSVFLNKQDILNILKSYAGVYETPPPSPEWNYSDKINTMVSTVPASEFPQPQKIFDEEYCWNDDDLSVEMPYCDSDVDETV